MLGAYPFRYLISYCVRLSLTFLVVICICYFVLPSSSNHRLFYYSYSIAYAISAHSRTLFVFINVHYPRSSAFSIFQKFSQPNISKGMF